MTSQRNKIAPISIFFCLYISRTVVSLTNVQAIVFGNLNTDILISLVISLGLTLVLSIPVIYCYKYKKNPFDIAWLGYFYFAYFIFITAINISKFSYFASTVLNPESQAWMFVLLFSVCIYYCSKVGIEAISRFSAFGFALVILAFVTILLCDLSEFDEINLYPVINNKTSDIFKNALILSSNTSEIIVFLCLSKRVNGVPVKAFVGSILASYVTIFILLYFMFASLGNGTALQSYPLYTMFQISKINAFERLDVLHISFWILGVLIKTVLSAYCATISIKKFAPNLKCAVMTVLTFALSIIIVQSNMSNKMNPLLIIIPFVVFCVLIPLATLIFKKRNSADEILESF